MYGGYGYTSERIYTTGVKCHDLQSDVLFPHIRDLLLVILQKQYYMIVLSFLVPVGIMTYSYAKAAMTLYRSVRELKRMTGMENRLVALSFTSLFIY